MGTDAIQNPLLEWDFAAQWHVLPGMAHGSRQPVMLGVWLSGTDLPDGLSAVDRGMALFLPEPLPADMALPVTAEALVRRVLFWSGAVQRRCQIPVFEAARVWPDPDAPGNRRLLVAMPYVAPEASWSALRWVAQRARNLLARPSESPQDLEQARAEFEQLISGLQQFRSPGYNTIRFLKAAHGMDIPVRSVVQGVHAFGQGRHCRWLESSYTEQTPVIGTRIARDKFRTAQVLRQFGLPAPTHARATSAQQAVQIARQLGYPVVVKPADRDQGLGVAADLRDDAAVASAFQQASRHSSYILVEKHVDGVDYRLTVLHGSLLKTVVRRPAGVTGDGEHSISQLVEIHLRDQPAREIRLAHDRAALMMDAEALELLAQNGMSADTVVPDGRYVCLRRRANVAVGGTPLALTQAIHPDNQRLAERAAQALQLDVAGVDLIMADISRSWFETGALICEVNSQPQIGDGVTPGIYVEVLRALLPAQSRIPLVLVVGDGPAIGVARQILQLGISRGATWALACTDGVWEGCERMTGPTGAFAAARIALAGRTVDAAVIVMSQAQILSTGMPFDQCDVLVLTAPQDAALWDRDKTARMWSMVLPHLTRAVVYEPRGAPCLPEPSMLQGSNLALVAGPDDASSLAERVLEQLGG